MAHLQAQADDQVRAEYARLDQPLNLIPRSLDVDERAHWVLAQLRHLHLLPGGTPDDH
jgi:hypothetical protein